MKAQDNEPTEPIDTVQSRSPKTRVSHDATVFQRKYRSPTFRAYTSYSVDTYFCVYNFSISSQKSSISTMESLPLHFNASPVDRYS